jgi:ketosteroid isomerase-like protein
MTACVSGDPAALADVVTDDVTGWSPTTFVTSREELLNEVAARVDAFTGVEIVIDTLDVGRGRAIAEWRMAAEHTRPMVIDADGVAVTIQPTGERVYLAGASFAEFDGARISSFRHYFDDAALLEQLLAVR